MHTRTEVVAVVEAICTEHPSTVITQCYYRAAPDIDPELDDPQLTGDWRALCLVGVGIDALGELDIYFPVLTGESDDDGETLYVQDNEDSISRIDLSDRYDEDAAFYLQQAQWLQDKQVPWGEIPGVLATASHDDPPHHRDPRYPCVWCGSAWSRSGQGMAHDTYDDNPCTFWTGVEPEVRS